MNKPKVRRIYLKLLSLAAIPFLLSGCDIVDCKVPETHVHKYVGKNNRGTIVNYVYSEQQTLAQIYTDSRYDRLFYERQDDYIEVTNDDLEFYKAKGLELFKGEDNWDYLFKLMSTKKDYIEYYCRSDDGFGGWSYYWDKDKPDRWSFDEKIRVCHYRFCGHKLTYKDGKWVDERSPFVDDIREIIDEYPYFQLDCYKVVYKEYKVDEKKLNSIKLEDYDEFTGPNLVDPELHKVQK